MKIAIFTDVYIEASGGIPNAIRAQADELERQGHTVRIFCPGSRVESCAGECVKNCAENCSENCAGNCVKGCSENCAGNCAGKCVGNCAEEAKVDPRVILVATHPKLRIEGAPVALRPEKIEAEIMKQFPDFGKSYDIIHVHWEASCSLAGMRLAKKFRIPLVMTMHGREDIGLTAYVPRGLRNITAWMITTAQKRYIPYEVKVLRDNYLAKNYMQRKMWELMVNQANCADVVITPSEHFRRKLEHYGVKRKIVAVPTGAS